MAEQQQQQPASAGGPAVTMADIQRRAADDPNVKYRAFDSYPWTKDPSFITQLAKALYEPASDGEQRSLSALALDARIARFEAQTGLKVDAAEYQEWLAQNNAQPPNIVAEQTVIREATTFPDPQQRRFAQLLVEQGHPLGQAALEHTEPPASQQQPQVPVPSWQSAAPVAELWIEKDAAAANGNGNTGGGDDGDAAAAGAGGGGEQQQPSYPKKFEQIIEFLQSGKPIEGIRQIPDTVHELEDPAAATLRGGSMAAPKKPWER